MLTSFRDLMAVTFLITALFFVETMPRYLSLLFIFLALVAVSLLAVVISAPNSSPSCGSWVMNLCNEPVLSLR